MEKLLEELERRKRVLEELISCTDIHPIIIPDAKVRLMEVKLWIEYCKDRIKELEPISSYKP